MFCDSEMWGFFRSAVIWRMCMIIKPFFGSVSFHSAFMVEYFYSSGLISV